ETPNHWKFHERVYRVTHPIYDIWGVTLRSLALDTMHCMDLGVTGHACANMLYEVVFEHEHGTRSAILARLWARIQDIYRVAGLDHRISVLRLGTFVKNKDSPHSDYPILSRTIKAAEARHLATVCYQLSKDYEDDTQIRKTRTLCFKSLCQIYQIIADGDMFLSDAQCQQLIRSADNFLTCYQALSRDALDQRKLKWSIVNKHHFAWHLVRQTPLNPKNVWCYQAEDYQRFVTR
ncbi:unnamed protein product, partial [Prorocentrum cordatum]